MLKVENLSKKFGKKEILHSVTTTFSNGVYGLLGPNGAGKTTFIRCLLNLYKFQGYCCYLDDESGEERKEIKVGYLPQKNSVFPGLTVREQLEYFALMKEIEKDYIETEVERVLELVNLKDFANIKGKKLSGGMIRRLGVAQALLGQPQLVIFDEPTTGLDPEERVRFKNIVKKIGKETIVIMSTHIVEDIEAVCDFILIMKDGNIIANDNQVAIASIATGKVYEKIGEDIPQDGYVVKHVLVDGEEGTRFLYGEELMETSVQPTVEDGYLCLLNNV
ncbi:MAG: ATP-binding cassette domain-containing protein [Lachnospiraceae bacterium]|nr:ATP-binding cassette domain-containing protein [Lachnospiraceae bacterium]